MTKREALRKLKSYWLSNSGSDYLRALRRLLVDLSPSHDSTDALNGEISAIAKAHNEFIEWTKKPSARRRLVGQMIEEMEDQK